MRRVRSIGVLLAVVLVAAGCGSGKKVGGGGLGTTVPSNVPTTSDACQTTALRGTDVGITPKTITVTVTADTGSPLDHVVECLKTGTAPAATIDDARANLAACLEFYRQA